MPGVPKLQDLLKCIQIQFATERQRAVVDCLDLDEHVPPDKPLQNYIEGKLLENGAPAGLFNVGNTCFANAALQALLVCTPLTGYFVDQFARLRHTVDIRQESIGHIQNHFGFPKKKLPPYVAVELSQVVATLLIMRDQNDSFSPSRLINLIRRLFPQFTMGQQHDAQEFISCLLDRLHEELQYPVLQLTDETCSEDGGDSDENASSTKSDYESCMSLISEDSMYSLSAGDDETRVEDSEGLNDTLKHPTTQNRNGRSLDGDSAQDSMTEEASEEAIPEDSEMLSDTPPLKSPTNPEVKSPRSQSKASRIVTWRSVIQDLFYGDFAVSVECSNCGEVSTRYEGFQMLEVSIPSDDQILDFNQRHPEHASSVEHKPAYTASRWPKWMSLKSSNTKRRVPLMTCLRHELKPEELTGENQYHCDQCNQDTDAVKYIRISRLPEILIVHLKRFKYESQGSFMSNFTNPDRKIHDLVDFQMDEFLDPVMFNTEFSTKYELRSVISHAGSTLTSGHYTTFVKIGEDPKAAKWYTCNDTDVREVDTSTITDTEAYILFYVRVDPENADKLASFGDHFSPAIPADSPDGDKQLPDYPEATSPRSQQLFPPSIFSSLDSPSSCVVSKEWWSKVKWSNMPHRMTAQDLICPHRLLLPGILVRLSDLSIPLSSHAFEKLFELFDGTAACRLLAKQECPICARTIQALLGMYGPQAPKQ